MKYVHRYQLIIISLLSALLYSCVARPNDLQIIDDIKRETYSLKKSEMQKTYDEITQLYKRMGMNDNNPDFLKLQDNRRNIMLSELKYFKKRLQRMHFRMKKKISSDTIQGTASSIDFSGNSVEIAFEYEKQGKKWELSRLENINQITGSEK
jgi:hypothetical protein